MNKESYGIPEDDFSGDDVCDGCPKLEQYKSFLSCSCGSYSKEGQTMRQKAGYCPLSSRYADWRTDKPVKVVDRYRVGQQKQK